MQEELESVEDRVVHEAQEILHGVRRHADHPYGRGGPFTGRRSPQAHFDPDTILNSELRRPERRESERGLMFGE